MDAAQIQYESKDDIIDFFWKGIKKKGIHKKKYFRLDAGVAVDEAIALIDDFFPIEELTHEYFEQCDGWVLKNSP